jgi:LuxR family maltose regulon positive regulatory protein
VVAPLLTTKLYIPPLRPNLVPRPRLNQRLSDRVGHKLTLVSAPAGFGKTTLLSAWIHAGEQRVTWLSLDEGDNDPARFWTYVIAALQRLHARIGETALSLLESPQPPPPEALLTLLLNDIAAFAQPFSLVLDDYHVITAQGVHQGVAFLLDHLPPQMHLMITSRADPPLALTRLRARNQLTEIRAADLRFTAEEAAAFLNEVMGLGLTAEQVAALETRTEGWIAGLQLAALSMQGRDDLASFIAAFTGSNAYIVDYLVEEVLQRQPEDVQTFLMRTCVLDRLSGALSDAVTGQDDGQAMLEHLYHANLFLIPLGDERKWYRYHHLFAEVLRNRLRQSTASQPGLVLELHRRASAWFEHNGLLPEAVQHALAAADFERVADLIEHSAGVLFARPGLHGLLNTWLAALPGEIMRARPTLCILLAWLLFDRAQIDAAEQRLQDAEQALRHADLTDAIRDRLGTIAGARAMAAALRGDATQAIAYAEQALPNLRPDNLRIRGVVNGSLAVAYLSRGDLARAEQAFAEAVAMGRAAGNEHLALWATSMQTCLQRARGALRLALATGRQALDRAGERGLQLAPGLGGLNISMADVLRERNDLGAALHHADEAVAYFMTWGNIYLLLISLLVLARVKQAQGDLDGALAVVRRAQPLAQEHNVAPMLALLAAFEAQVRLAQGDLAAAVDLVQGTEQSVWSVEPPLHMNSFPIFPYTYEHKDIVEAQVWIAQGQAAADRALLEQAIALLERRRDEAEARGLPWLRIKSFALQALAYRALGDRAQSEASARALGQALTLAEPEGYVRVFVDEGPPMAELLRRAQSRGIAPAYVNKLLSAFPDGGLSSAVRRPPSLIEPLNERELEVLRLIADGLSNREIAGKLIIALSTVKWHINNLYGKLHVRSRTQALARAKELGLL